MIIRACAVATMLLFLPGAGRADELSLPTALDVFDKGGALMWGILAASIIGCAFTADRLLVIRRGRQIPGRLMKSLREAMVSGGVGAGLRAVKDDGSAMGQVMRALLSRSGATRRELENTVEDEASRILSDLRANLKPIGVMAVVSPQLGLLGTVFGLIAAFRAAAELGMDDPRNFAGGIYEALYTTAFGLVVGIPLVVAYHLLRNRADSIMREVEKRALAFISDASSRAEQRAARHAPPPDAETFEETIPERHERSDRLAAAEETSGEIEV